MNDTERLTHKRNNGIKEGYWTPSKKDELIERLAAYENTGLSPEEIQPAIDKSRSVGLREIATIMPEREFRQYLDKMEDLIEQWKDDGLKHLSLRHQVMDYILKMDEERFYSTDQLRRIFELAK
ncbi:MAG: hypothetical protein ACI4S2_01600 [Lachnospiraceae bacterium]